ncbi:Cna protein B-type domain-containing protein [Poseidonocella pacifica]|uniref:Cna protein B-type domain-containing protein n=1 Tax=Poseidonocella pacifica TaxID=871651 RepID=A0A1I0V3P3_9RHOB|nr:SdrD B-like domain-containing protein [Poseidonocella pacifica]SFA70733.1 Cna protein B-type domain-containing protein [Poseidonocella pacifica]
MTYHTSRYSSSSYSSSSYSYEEFEFSAFTEADLLQSTNGSSIGCGDSFTMPGAATVCISTKDNDSTLSGDHYENATDGSGQKATIDGAATGAQMYAESYHVLRGSDGQYYYLIEIEVEGYDAPGAGDDYFTFYGKVPPAGTQLDVVQTCDVSGCWIDYRCLGAGDKAPENTPPTFTNDPDQGKICVNENSTFVIDLEASDEDGDDLSYSISGGEDSGSFVIDPNTGVLSFIAPPDYEAPTDDDGDNIYEVAVTVSDGKGGEETKLLKVCVEDVTEGTGDCIVIEAESMDLHGYTTEDRGDASGGAGIKLTQSSGYASTTFEGEAGVYDLKLTYLDESDGQGKIKVYVNGEFVEWIHLNSDNGGAGGVSGSNWSTVTIDGLGLTSGDVITLKGVGDCGEFARIDKIELCEDDDPCITIEAEDMCAYGFKAYCAEQASEGMAVKLYCATEGKLSTTFKGGEGSYTLKIFAQDENDGQSMIVVKVNGVEVGTVMLDQDTDGSGSDRGPFSEITLAGLDLSYGDEITLHAKGDGGEFVRLDKIKICKDDTPKLGAIGDTVWFDADRDGVQDDDEDGIGGVTVTLLSSAGVFIASQVTADDGTYLFEGLEAGDYVVSFDLPDGAYAFTTQDVGDDADDSDADVTSGESGIITLAEGEINLTVDAGVVVIPGSLSGRYFVDDNANDVDDAEPGVEGVIVELLDATGAGTGITTQTDATGFYQFTGLEPGTYGVKFTDAVSGLTLVAPNQGTDDTIDSDATDLGSGMSEITGIVVQAGQDTPDNDAGVRDPGTASLGDRVWVDTDKDGVQDAGEVGLGGVVVTLYDETGSSIGSQITDGDGNYLFENLTAGEYSVGFAEPDGFDFTLMDQGSDADDSDADPTTGRTGTYTLAIGEENLTVDAGVFAENIDPEAADDNGKVCATEAVIIDVLANDGDADSDPLTVAVIDGVTVMAGDTVVLSSGASVTLNLDGSLNYNSDGATYGGIAAEDLIIGTDAVDSFTYGISDGNGGAAMAEVDVKICGALNTVETIADSLPAGGDMFLTIDSIGGQFYNVTISNTGDARFDGITFEQGYCVAAYDPIDTDVTVPFEFHLADETSVPPGLIRNPENLDLVNWVLNQDFGSMDNGDGLGETYTEAEIQGAIWGLTDDIVFVNETNPAFGTEENAQEIFDMAVASAEAEGFVPSAGQLVGLILDPTEAAELAGNVQPFIIAVPFDSLSEDCLCS